MSQEPKVTRFGADPTVDQELATKAYVDNQQVISNNFFLMWSTNDRIESEDGNFIWLSELTFLTTRNSRESPFPIACQVEIIECRCDLNANGNTNSMTLQNESVSTGLVIDIGAGLTGIFSDTGSEAFAVTELGTLIATTGADVTNACRIRGLSIGGSFT